MTSRRILSSEKNILEKDDPDERSPRASEKSDITPAVPASVIFKLLTFTAAMIGGPIGTYFLTLNTIYKGNSTWAGATAAFMANVVLLAYIMVAMNEDEGDETEKAKKKE